MRMYFLTMCSQHSQNQERVDQTAGQSMDSKEGVSPLEGSVDRSESSGSPLVATNSCGSRGGCLVPVEEDDDPQTNPLMFKVCHVQPDFQSLQIESPGFGCPKSPVLMSMVL